MMLAAVGLVAFMMTRRATAAPVQTRPVGNAQSSGASGMPMGSILRGLLGTGSSDVLQTGGYSGGSYGFNTIRAVDNATAAVQGQISADYAAGAGWLVPYNWNQWSMGGNSRFILPDQLNPTNDLLAGFDNPANYG
ncbi:hypothetical protein AT302_20780 [Pandoraea norimbergensis]|uniref:Uncharacterized protein n=2 Tax=Pandoraea norimbergensis TaxID=93219 RepID=A0ABN4JLH4_9BURK|nr:hypothetical protein AT302_20780 [Pandoraea norimbergensis]